MERPVNRLLEAAFWGNLSTLGKITWKEHIRNLDEAEKRRTKELELITKLANSVVQTRMLTSKDVKAEN